MSTLHRLFAATAFASALGALATTLAAPNDCASRGGYWEHRSETMEQHHKRLHTALKLTPEQESAWTRLVDAVPPRPRRTSARPTTGRSSRRRKGPTA